MQNHILPGAYPGGGGEGGGHFPPGVKKINKNIDKVTNKW